MDFLPDFFLLEVALFTFFEPFDEFMAFVAELEPAAEEAAGAGEWEWPEFEEVADDLTVGKSTGLTGSGDDDSSTALPFRMICESVWAWRKMEYVALGSSFTPTGFHFPLTTYVSTPGPTSWSPSL